MIRRNTLSLLLFLISIPSLWAQQSSLSPYSGFGLGQSSPFSSGRFESMGGVGIGMNSTDFVNVKNPASYVGLGITMYEFGANSTFNSMEQNGITTQYSNPRFSHLLLGADLGEKAGLVLGVLPYSDFGYNVTHSSKELPFGTIGDTVLQTQSVNGNGGVNRFLIGGAYQLTKELSVGVNASYYFGGLTRSSNVEFDKSTYLSSKSEEELNIQDIGFDFGLQYQKPLTETRTLNLGLVFSPGAQLNADQSFFDYTYKKNSSSETFQDTIRYQENGNGDVGIPLSFGLGFSLQEFEKWSLGADVNYTSWEDVDYFGENLSKAKNELRLALGGALRPNKNDVRNFWKRLEYRAGLNYSTGSLQFTTSPTASATAIQEFGINFGVGIPMRKSKTSLNLGFELGQRGTTDDQLVKETYFKTSLSLTFRDKWFVKRKID